MNYYGILIIHILLLISLMSTGTFGLWGVFAALDKTRDSFKMADNKIRKINDVYIIVPALNEHETILNTVSNLLMIMKQVPAHTKLVVVDDASDDGTYEKLLSYRNNPLVKIIHRVKPDAQTGKGHALNAGLHWIEQDASDQKKQLLGLLIVTQLLGKTIY